MKKNVLKKFAAAALAAATVMSSMSVMAFAADTETGTTEEKGSVTITKYMGDTGTGDTLSPGEYNGVAPTGEEYTLLQGVEFAYVEVGERVQVDTGKGKSSQTEIQYNVTNNAFLEAIGIKAGVGNYTQTQLNNAIKAKKNKTIEFVKENATNSNKMSTAAESGEAKFEGLFLDKLYVFAETDAKNAALASNATKKVNVTKVSVPFLVSLPFTGKDGNPVTELKVYPKNSTGTESIDKNIIEGNQKKKTTVANIGDTINYEVEYSIPVTEQGLVKLVVKDTMSKGLTFDENSNIIVKNKGVEVDSANYDMVPTEGGDGTTITITFKEAYCKNLEKNTTQNFTITYKATLNNNAVLGQSGNTNRVIVTYQNDKDSKTITSKDTKVFTYGIDLTKQGEGGAKLSGVEFKLTEGTNEIKVLRSGDAYYPSNDAKASSTVTTDEGKIYIRGLKPGTYKLTETKTNAGYVLLKDPVVIVIKDDNATGDATADVGSKPVTMQNDQKNSTSATAEVPLTVVNSKGFDLPVTGGRGIALFTIAGIAIVAAAGSLLFMRKRSK